MSKDIHIITAPDELQQGMTLLRNAGRRIALVPTMGNLHDGHLSLIRLARQQADIVVVSIFVNPAQFGPNEDFSTYPRTFERDVELCQNEGVDIVFHPAPEAMYPEGHSVWVDEDSLSEFLCGADRPGHFRGVCTIVLKLFNLALPHVALFGRKDAQQLRIIRRMVRDLNVPVDIVGAPIVREADGLALSSRNQYLSATERADALHLSRAMTRVKEMFDGGEREANVLLQLATDEIQKADGGRIDYVSIVDDETLKPISGRIECNALLAVAVKIGRTRLIDNVELAP